MDAALQTLLAYAVVIAAVLGLGLRAWRRRRAPARCDGCHASHPVRAHRSGVRPAALRVLEPTPGTER